MKPEAALRELETHAAGGGALKRADPELAESINQSYYLLRRWIAILAIALPVILWIGHWPLPQPSISQYYHEPAGWMRDIFVGTLSAVGFFLYFYKGYSRIEDWVLNCAGLAAVMVALAPMPWSGEVHGPRLFPDGPIHGISAATLFVLIAYVCIGRSGDTLRLIDDEAKRRWFKRIYALLGTLMVAVPTTIFVLHLVWPREGESRVIFAIETAGIAVFAVFWLLKSREIAAIQAQA